MSCIRVPLSASLIVSGWARTQSSIKTACLFFYNLLNSSLGHRPTVHRVLSTMNFPGRGQASGSQFHSYSHSSFSPSSPSGLSSATDGNTKKRPIGVMYEDTPQIKVNGDIVYDPQDERSNSRKIRTASGAKRGGGPIKGPHTTERGA